MQGGFEVFRTKKGAIGAFRCLSSLFVPRRNHKQYTYGFDHNGNPTTTHEQYAPPLQGQPNPSGPIDLIQENYWDEQNQLRGLWNLSGLHHYIYDADGQRLMKSSVPMSYSSVNAQQLQATNSIAAQDYTVYVSAGLVYESNRGSTTYTKHYYAGPLRVASQICSANPNQVTHPKTGNLTQRGPAGSTAQTNGQAVLSDLNTLLANYGMAVDANEPPHDTLSMQVINDPDECRMFYGDDLIEENRCLCDNFPDIAIQQGIDCNPYTPIYWYHPDYIGNVEFVSDRTGQPYQHFYYAAFGDPMVSQHAGTGSFNSAFRFNAKEYDEETGNYYYGARYYEPKSSVWMGVDALATKYPSMNPYNFVMGNPIMAMDPDGDTAWTATNEWTLEWQEKYENNVYQKTQEYISNGREFTCEDLALSLLLDFSYENKLPVTIQNGSGIYSNHSNDYSDSETFINRILSTTAASDLQNNNNTLPVDSRLNASEGDIILFRNENGRAKHTQVIVAVEYYGSNPLYQIRQGNMWLPRWGSSGDPSSFMYSGVVPQRGLYLPKADHYVSPDTGSNIKGFSEVNNIEIRRFNFNGF